MRIFITGSNGFVAQKFCELLKKQSLPYVVYGVSKSQNRNIFLPNNGFGQLDLVDLVALEGTIQRFEPTHILHTAALTSVEECEVNNNLAFEINVGLTAFLADYCERMGIHLTFLSTDFVFDGKAGPYAENDPTNPVNYYGKTKVLAEQAILNTTDNAAILRTILVYGVIPDLSRSNLVLWAKKELEEGNAIRVVSDQWRMPTWVDDLAMACLQTIERSAHGIFHISGEELMSVEEVVYALQKKWNLNGSLISSVSARELGQENNRPRRTGFDIRKAKRELDFKPTLFLDSLTYICEQLKNYGR